MKAAFLRTTLVVAGAIGSKASVIPQHPLAPAPEDDTQLLPLVIWHGLGDNYKAEGLRSVGDLATKANPGTFVYYVRIDDDDGADKQATFLGNVTEQVVKVCTDLASHPILSTAPAINALGFSQGGQFLRAYVERCNSPPVASLVTFGSQHNGIAEFQNCASGDWLCKAWEGLLKGQTWSSFAQGKLVPAQYYRDPEDLDAYLESSNFLADINNERALKNETYAENMRKLRRFVMYVFAEDVTVVPRQSGWFSEYNATSGKETRLTDRKLYEEDWLGLKSLDEAKRLEFREIEGPHMALSEEILIDAFEKYFSPGDWTGLGVETLANEKGMEL